MDYITTTELRTKSSKLIEALKQGKTVKLIHRSQVVGVIQQEEEARPLTKEDIATIKKAAQKLKLPKTTYEEREKIYRERLMKKYGKYLS